MAFLPIGQMALDIYSATSKAVGYFIGAAMIVIQVSAVARIENGIRFLKVLREVVAEAREVSGCMRYDWFHSPDDHRHVFVYGEFESEETFAKYQQGPVVKKIVAELMPLLETRPTYKHFRAELLTEG